MGIWKSQSGGGGGGAVDLAAAEVVTASAMGALVVDTSKELNTKSISVDSTLTFSGTPGAAHTIFGLYLTNTDTVSHIITIPSSYSVTRQTLITSFTIPASSELDLVFRWTGSKYVLYGDPAPNAYTLASRPSAVAAGAGALIQVYDSASGIDATQTSDGSRWVGTTTLNQSRPSIKLPTSTIGTGASAHLTVGTALPVTYANGAWCYFEAVASTPAITAGLYWVVFSSTTVGTIYQSGPGSSAFNFTVGATMTAAIASDVNLFVPDRTSPNVDGALIPGGFLGPLGAINLRFNTGVTNNANSKTIKSKLGGVAGTVFHEQNSLTTGGSRGSSDIVCTGSESQQMFHGGATDNMSWVEGQTGSSAPNLVAIDMSADTRVAFTGRVAAATDFVILNRLTATLECQ